MGDVVTALGRAVQEEGHKVEVVLPKYDCIQYDEVGLPHGHLIMSSILCRELRRLWSWLI